MDLIHVRDNPLCDPLLEAYPQQMCDAATNTTFIRWYSTQNGVPTGQFVDKTLAGVDYQVSDEENVSFGECKVICADEPIRDCNGLIIGYGYTAATASAVGATVPLTDCNNVTLAYAMPVIDTDHTVPIQYCDGTAVAYLRSSGCNACCKETEQIVMCNNGVTFVRHFVFSDGSLDYTFDTDKNGAAYTVVNETNVTVGACVANTTCAPITEQGVVTSW